MDQVRAAATKRGWFVFDSYLPYSSTFLRAIQQQRAPFETKGARRTLKRRIATVIDEVRVRIATLAGKKA